MADVTNGNPGTAPSSPAPSQDGGRPAPAAPQVDHAEFQRLQSEVSRYQREEQQYKSNRDFYNKAKAYGFDKPEAFDQYGPAIKTMRDHNIDPGSFAKAFATSQQDNPDASAAVTIKEVEALLGQKLTESKKEWIREQAEESHGKALAADLEELSESKIAEALGKDVPDEFKKLAARAVVGIYNENRPAYGDDHPIKGFAPGGQKAIAAAIQAVKDGFAKTATALKAKDYAAIGDAARTATPSTLAGKSGATGAPATKDANETKEQKTRRLVGDTAGRLGLASTV